MTTTYYIPTYVHFATDESAVVFMNLRRDQYSMFVGSKALAFKDMLLTNSDSVWTLTGYPRNTHSDPHANAQDLDDQMLADLLRNELLTTDRSRAASPKRNDIFLPNQDLIDWNTEEPPRIRLRDVCRFAMACTLVSSRLRFSHIETITRSIERRKSRQLNARTFSMADIRRLVNVYTRLRPLFPRNFLCLFDSLSLLEFLARYNFFPDMVFAVRVDPWSAHCWLQYGTVSLNQDWNEARSYLPIMVI
jgi:hypothetical protein